MTFRDHFSTRAAEYAHYRPQDAPELAGWLGTWSATARYREVRGQDPAPALEAGRGWWGERRQVRWPLWLRVGRV